jgi:hypothetical protein
MPPLTRQETFDSIRSWWSDSNPNLRGPTINLHTAAKPLMRLMYDRQALEFMRNARSIPLASTDAEIYGSYLSYVAPSRHSTPRVDSLSRCEHVSLSTKRTILEDLALTAQSEHVATVVHAYMLHDILKLLETPVSMDTRMLVAVRLILCALAECEATAEATCTSFVTLVW